MATLSNSVRWNPKNRYYLDLLDMIDHRSEKVKLGINMSKIINDAFTFAVEKGMPIRADKRPLKKELAEGWIKHRIYMENKKLLEAQKNIEDLVQDLNEVN